MFARSWVVLSPRIRSDCIDTSSSKVLRSELLESAILREQLNEIHYFIEDRYSRPRTQAWPYTATVTDKRRFVTAAGISVRRAVSLK